MRVIRKSIRFLLQADGTPERLALAFSLGVFLGFSPLLGLHTLLGLAFALLFRLNKLVVLMGVYLNNPWVIAPFYGFSFLVGIQLTGTPQGAASIDQMLGRFAEAGFMTLLQADFWNWTFSQWRLLIPVFVGSTVLCTVMALLAYPFTLWLLRRFKPRTTGDRTAAAKARTPLLGIRKTP